jgi:hypothetical protein
LHTNKKIDESLTLDISNESDTSSHDDDSFTDQLLNLRLSRKTITSDENSGSEENSVFYNTSPPRDTITEEDIKPRKLSKKKVANRVSETSNITEHVCGTCQLKFLSKNKLFCHLRSENHAQSLLNRSMNKNRNKEKKKKKSKNFTS